LRAKRDSLSRYKPYNKQTEFHAAGKTHRERLFMAGNQLGKTLAGGHEVAMHATGRYPEGWKGKRFPKANSGWAAGVTGETTRDSLQLILLGPKEAHGTGAIPHDAIIDITKARGVPDLVDNISVRHATGEVSHIGLKSYEKGRSKWQAATLGWVWFDEEPPAEIYTEGLTRTNATGGLVFTTFTPLLGMSSVVSRFLMEENTERHVTKMTIDDAEHYTSAQRQKIIDSYAPHEREARANGVPIMGSGRVFAVEESSIREKPREIPEHWPRIAGLDIGWDHPTAVVWIAWDRDSDCIHVYATHRLREETPVVHAAAIRAKGDWIPVAWPHDALQHDKGSGATIAEQYKRQGVTMLDAKATFEDGGNGVEAGLMDILDRMKTGRFKVDDSLEDWWEEFRMYHRKNGQVVKERDDLMSATRYGIMMIRESRVKPQNIELTIDTDWVI
jgi:phage terminase large subunit-like protein